MTKQESIRETIKYRCLQDRGVIKWRISECSCEDPGKATSTQTKWAECTHVEQRHTRHALQAAYTKEDVAESEPHHTKCIMVNSEACVPNNNNTAWHGYET